MILEFILCILIATTELTIAATIGLAIIILMQYIFLKVFKVNLYKRTAKFFINLEKRVELI